MTQRERDMATEFVRFCNDLQASGIVFQWGQWDCNTFVLAWVDRVAGTDNFAEFAGYYDSEDSARAFASGLGRTLWSVCNCSGLVEVPGGVRFAQPGDVLLVRDPGEPWLRGHVCAGATFASVWPGRGFDLRPMRYMPDAAVVMRYC